MAELEKPLQEIFRNVGSIDKYSRRLGEDPDRPTEQVFDEYTALLKNRRMRVMRALGIGAGQLHELDLPEGEAAERAIARLG